jgi:hypothetical protein
VPVLPARFDPDDGGRARGEIARIFAVDRHGVFQERASANARNG